MAAPYNFLLELLDYIQTRLPTLNQALPSCGGTHQSHLRTTLQPPAASAYADGTRWHAARCDACLTVDGPVAVHSQHVGPHRPSAIGRVCTVVAALLELRQPAHVQKFHDQADSLLQRSVLMAVARYWAVASAT
jgi:hypothetical protein